MTQKVITTLAALFNLVQTHHMTTVVIAAAQRFIDRLIVSWVHDTLMEPCSQGAGTILRTHGAPTVQLNWNTTGNWYIMYYHVRVADVQVFCAWTVAGGINVLLAST